VTALSTLIRVRVVVETDAELEAMLYGELTDISEYSGQAIMVEELAILIASTLVSVV